MRTQLVLLLALVIVGNAVAAEPSKETAPTFRAHHIGTYRGEACGVGDFNKDGKLDIVALPFLYLSTVIPAKAGIQEPGNVSSKTDPPDSRFRGNDGGLEFKPIKICDVQGEVDESGKGYHDDFMNAPIDADGDGWLDVATCTWFAKKAEWLRNPGAAGGEWTRHLIEEYGNYECGELWDIDGDGKPLEILPVISCTAWYEPGKLPDGTRGMVKHLISDKPMEWGAGVGDLNGDGHPDVIRPNGWFEGPADPRTGTWKAHPLEVTGRPDGIKGDTAQILVYDVNADGLPDIIASAAHDYGIFWFEQTRKGEEVTWTQHLIDKSWSQAHSLALADINNDGTPDLITGKRFMAHNGGDPGENEPIGVYWYELKRGPSPEWTKHVVSLNEGIGSGLNIVAADLDADGDLDIVVTGKWGGPVWFENTLK